MSNFVPEIVYASRVFRAPYAHLTHRASSGELDSLRRSIRQVGVRSPILVDASDNIIDGYRRLVSCLDLGMRLDEVPIEVRDVPGWEAESLAVRLNEHRMKSKKRTKLCQVSKPRPRRRGNTYGPLLPEFLEKVQEYRNMQLSGRNIALLLNVSLTRVNYAFRHLPLFTGVDRRKTYSLTAQAAILRSIGREDLAKLNEGAYLSVADPLRCARARITFRADDVDNLRGAIRRSLRHPKHGWKFAPDTLRHIAKVLNEVADEAEAGGDKK